MRIRNTAVHSATPTARRSSPHRSSRFFPLADLADTFFLVMFSGFSEFSGWKRFFFVDTDLAAILDLAFYFKEPLILG